MKVSFLQFIQAANCLQVDASVRGCVLAGGIALAVARALPLPTSPAEAPGQYYNFNNLQLVKDILAAFNEQVVFDAPLALNETREFWMLRYTAAHPADVPVYDPTIGFYDNLAGVPRWVARESHCFNNQYKNQLFAVQVAASSVIRELQKSYV
jgi:hypothetical protein